MVFVYMCPNCHKPITSRLEKFKCWYCNTYFENTSDWEIKELSEAELNAIQGKSNTPVTQTPVTPTTTEMLNALNNKPWEFAWEKISGSWQALIALLTVVCILSIFIDPSTIGTIQVILGLIIGWFWTGPWCWKIAYEKGRNQLWAWSVGFFFAIPGAIVYWIYLLFHKKVNNIPV